MIVNSREELVRALADEMKKAMNELNVTSKNIVESELKAYYAGTSPKMYKRTGMLESSGEVTNVSGDRAEMSFIARMKKDYTYPSITYTYPDGGHTTSKSPSMEDVLNLTNDGITSSSVGRLHPAIGRGGYWDRIEEKIEESQNTIMGNHFH